MGTRHLIAIVQDGAPKVAQYGQWDGYPSGQGADIVGFLAGADLGAFKDYVRAARSVGREEANALRRAEFVRLGVTPNTHGLVPAQSAADVDRALPWCSRDFGAKVLPYILTAKGVPVLNSDWEFAEDSLWCEWAYVIDLDADTLEVYKGFQTEAHDSGRWAAGEPKPNVVAGADYYPVRLIATVPLAGITPESFKAALHSDDE